MCAPDDGWRNHPKHVEQFTEINKLCNVASCWLYSYFAVIYDAQTAERQIGLIILCCHLKPWGWHFGADTCRSWHFTWIVFYCVSISVFCWLIYWDVRHFAWRKVPHCAFTLTELCMTHSAVSVKAHGHSGHDLKASHPRSVCKLMGFLVVNKHNCFY